MAHHLQRFRMTATGLLAFAISSALHAQPQTQSDGGTRFVVGDITEILVRESSRNDRVDIPGAVDVISRDQLRNEHVNLTMDLFKKVPGVTFSRYNQGIVSMDIAIRGFNAEGEAPNTKLSIDGIPSNLHVGLPEMDALFPLELDHVEVVKGTQDPRYGLLNIAGNINMYTRREEGRELELLTGSFGTLEAQGYLGLQSGDLSHSYVVGHRQTDGYRDNAGMDKTTLAGKWFYAASDALTVGLIARTFEFSADAPGYLSAAQARATPAASPVFSASDGGDKSTDHLSVHLDYAFSSALTWSLKVYRQDFERNRWVRFTAAGAQQERVEQEEQTGLISTLAWMPREGTLVNWGVDTQQQDNLAQRFRTVERVRTGLVQRNWRFEYDTRGTYVQLQQDVRNALRLTVALRADRLSGEFLNQANGAQADMNDYGTIMQPKLGALWTMTDQIDLFANAGRSFQAGVGAGAYPAPGKDVDVSVNDGWEAGVSVQPTERWQVRLSNWRQTATDELQLKADNSGDFENIGKTTRGGWELTSTWRPGDAWYLWGSYSLQSAELTNPGPLNAALAGNDLHHVPDYTASLGVEYQVTPDLRATLFSNWQGDAHMVNANNVGRFGGYALTDLSFNYEAAWGEVNLRVNNLFDRYYEYVWFDGATTLHSPGADRHFDLSLAFDF